MRIARFVAIVLATLLSLAPSARAQGTMGQVPEPISTADLRRLLDRYVHPTKAQWDSIESLHDDYREAFRQLREGEIEKFLKSMSEMQGGLPTRQAVEEFMRKYNRVTTKIEELDGTLLEGIGAIVGEDKRAALGRTRDARARQRDLTGGITGGLGGGMMDLSEIALDALESEADRAAIDPSLLGYEQRLTSLSRTLGEDARRMILDLFKELEKQGFADISQEDLMKDPERMKQMMEAMQSAWKTVGAKVQKHSQDGRELNSKMFRSLLGQLQGDSSRRFRTRYIARAHSELAHSNSHPERFYRAALRISKLDPDVKTGIKTAYDSWMKSDDAIVDEGIKLNDAFAASRDMMSFDGGAWQQHSEDMQAIRTRRDELGQKAIAALSSMMGDERFKGMTAKLQMKAQSEDLFAETGDPEADSPELAIGAAASPLEARQADFRIGRDSPIGIATIQSLASSMGVDDTQKATLETLHSDYLKKWDEDVKPTQEEMAKAQAGIWVSEGEGMPAHMDAAKSALASEKQKAVTERASVVDDALFDDAAKAIGEAHADALRMAKLERGIDRFLRISPWGGGMFGGMQEQPVNLARVLKSTDLPVDVRTRGVKALIGQADDLSKAYRETFFESLDVERKMQDLNLKWQETFSSGGEADIVAQTNYGRDSMSLQQRLGDVAARRSKVADEALAAVLDAVGDDHRTHIRLEYNKLAYPSIFSDPLSALPLIEKASAMSDLTADQKTQLTGLHNAYEKEYMDACQKMVPKLTVVNPDAKPELRFRDEMLESGARAKVQFDRDERSARAVSQLKRILNEEQQQRIPALSEYEKSAKSAPRGRFG